VSYQLVSRHGGRETVATHWSYWAADGRHLFDVLVCLTPNDTTVMDVGAVQGEVQIAGTNQRTGGAGDLSGERGIVVVVAYETEAGGGGGAAGCRPRDPSRPTAERALVGSWTIADPRTNAAFGSDALGLAPDVLPDPMHLEAGLWIGTFNPESLGDSAVILIGLQTMAGRGRSRTPSRGRSTVCCRRGPRCAATWASSIRSRIGSRSRACASRGWGSAR